MIDKPETSSAAADTAIDAFEIKSFASNAADWDSFAERCGASMQSTSRYVRAWAAKNILHYRLRFFEFYVGGRHGQKIGQCVVGQARRGSSFVFLDRLELLPTHELSWGAAMRALLSVTG